MADKLDEILGEIRSLNTKLYGENGFDGDIPDIKACYKDHSKRIGRIEIIIAGMIGAGALSGGTFGLIKLLG